MSLKKSHRRSCTCAPHSYSKGPKRKYVPTSSGSIPPGCSEGLEGNESLPETVPSVSSRISTVLVQESMAYLPRSTNGNLVVACCGGSNIGIAFRISKTSTPNRPRIRFGTCGECFANSPRNKDVAGTPFQYPALVARRIPIFQASALFS